jgi:hypothetical protein
MIQVTNFFTPMPSSISGLLGDWATPVSDLPPGIDILTRLAAADAEGPVIVEQHHEAGAGEGLGEPCDAEFLHAGVAVGHRDRWARLRIALRKIEPGAKFYTVVRPESDFAMDGHRALFAARGIFEPTVIEAESAGRTEKGARERCVEPACDDAHLLVLELSKQGRWPVVFEDSVSGVIFVEHHADWRVLRRPELMSRHERGRNSVADVILSRVARATRDLQQRAVIANQEDRQFRTMPPFMLDALDISLGEELENFRIE